MVLRGYLALSGAVAGTGVFLLIAGAAKLRTAGGDSAIRRALRLGPAVYDIEYGFLVTLDVSRL